jgi:hypothetical protein
LLRAPKGEGREKSTFFSFGFCKAKNRTRENGGNARTEKPRCLLNAFPPKRKGNLLFFLPKVRRTAAREESKTDSNLLFIFYKGKDSIVLLLLGCKALVASQ